MRQFMWHATLLLISAILHCKIALMCVYGGKTKKIINKPTTYYSAMYAASFLQPIDTEFDFNTVEINNIYGNNHG